MTKAYKVGAYKVGEKISQDKWTLMFQLFSVGQKITLGGKRLGSYFKFIVGGMNIGAL